MIVFNTIIFSISMNASIEIRTTSTVAPVRRRNARRLSDGITGELARILRGLYPSWISSVRNCWADCGSFWAPWLWGRLEKALVAVMRLDLKGMRQPEAHQKIIVDKIWHPHTNNGLKIAYAFGIVCVGQGEQRATRGDCWSWGTRALRSALAQKSNICQEQRAVVLYRTGFKNPAYGLQP
ncbi:MAG: hypothetical protein LBS77_07905 [Desulfovibrio sp.]|nr:hypothetical protein [Desulfovibrio sp.]